MKKTLHGRRHLRARVPIMRVARERRNYKRLSREMKLIINFVNNITPKFAKLAIDMSKAISEIRPAMIAMIKGVDWGAINTSINRGMVAFAEELKNKLSQKV